MKDLLDALEPKAEQSLKEKFLKQFIRIVGFYCLIYTVVYLSLGVFRPAIIEFIAGVIIWGTQYTLGTSRERVGIYGMLVVIYLVILIQIVLFFGGMYNFQYMLIGHIGIVLLIYENRPFYYQLPMLLYLLTTVVIIVTSHLWQAIYPVAFDARTVSIFQYTSQFAVLIGIVFFLFWLTDKMKQLTQSVDYLKQMDDSLPVRKQSALMRIGNQLFEKDQHFILMLIDTDHFKSINDTYGHDKGDFVLKALVEKISYFNSPQSMIARYGGSTFAVLMTGTSLEIVKDQAEWLRGDIASAMIKIDEFLSINVTVSIGVAERMPSHTRFSSTLSRADEALYLAKARGRDQVVILGKI
ncbi:GGDEF domain-containing protein [Fusibacter paucivorans]|uniref:GGDEF domain-containing protein n=1 Tax=Fusibacter paucivorans TaxID=76009 RepID=A0ABS5PR25_9FIRM|nr:GGDEF domain-containing protein [Fusibacter paucivorans]MBS7527625.1 GGDEF domain-containing protein [Fusibacter paucivorans]